MGPDDELAPGESQLEDRLEDRLEDSLDLAHTRERVLHGLFADQPVKTQDTQRFERIRTLGWGSMGRVDLAMDRTLGREVALKTINPSAADEPRARDRIHRESRALARIDHPNVVRVFDVFDVDGRLTLAMEYVKGSTLRTWSEGAPPLRTRLQVIEACARGLHAAHEAGVIHRDFKPENVMLSEAGVPKIVDFGLAKEAATTPLGSQGEDASREDGRSPQAHANEATTHQTARAGTPAYMAPEQAIRGEQSAAADQYALAMTAWEVLTGARPREACLLGEGDSRTTIEQPQWSASGKRALAQLARVERVLRRALELDPGARYPKLADFASELSAATLADLDGVAPGAGTRRRGLILGAAVGVAVAAGLFVATSKKAPPTTNARPQSQAPSAKTASPCELQLSALREAWPPSQRQVLADHFEKLAPAFGRFAGEAADQQVQLWIEQESVRATTRCADAQYQAAVAECVEHASSTVSILAKELVQLDKIKVAGVHRRIERSLQGEGHCDNPVRLELRFTRPSNPQLARRLTLALKTLDEAKLAAARGDYQSSLARAQAARTQFPQGESLAFDAELGLALARALFQAEQSEKAEAAFLAAAKAAEAAKLDTLVLWIWMDLVRFAAIQKIDSERAAFYFDRAEAALVRLGDPPRQRSVLEQRRAQVKMAAADFVGAQDDLARARAAASGLDERAAARRDGSIAQDEGRVAYSAGELEEAASTFARAVRSFEKGYGPDHPTVADARHNHGTVLVAANRSDEALAVLGLALEGRKRAYGPEHFKVGTTLNSLASVSYMREEFATAMQQYKDALALNRAAKPGKRLAANADVMSNIGRCASELGQHEDARRWFDDAIAEAKASLGEDHPRLADTLRGAVEAALVSGDASRALQLSKTTVAMRVESLGPDAPRVAAARLQLARAHHAARELKAARTELRTLLKHPAVDASQRLHAQLLLGAMAIEQGRERAARGAYAEAFAVEQGLVDEGEDIDGDLAQQLERAHAWTEGRESSVGSHAAP